MLLIVTKIYDPTADYVCERMKKRNILFVRINLDEVVASGTLEIDPVKILWSINTSKTIIHSHDISAIWQRRVPVIKAESGNSLVDEYISKEWRLAWEWWLNLQPDHIILDPEWRLKRAANKFLQLQTATHLGLRVPETLVTSDPDAFKRFFSKHNTIVAKLLGGFGKVSQPEQRFWTIYTNKLTEEDLRRAMSLRKAPVIFQEGIDKEFEIRTTLVGNQFFSCRINSKKSVRTQTDWRRYDFHNVPHSVIELPVEISEKLLQMARVLGIHFASFDLAVTPEGEYVLFEMNPNSQWVWIENLTSMPITDALIDVLQNKVFCSY